MDPIPSLTDRHHSFKASAQKSLVWRSPKISVRAPLASTRMPNGGHFLLAGGSCSSPLGVWPSESVRPFSPPTVVPLVHLGLGVHGDLQRLRVVPVRLAAGGHVGEDGVGLLGLLQRLGLLEAFEAGAHSGWHVAQGAVAGQAGGGVTLVVHKRLAEFPGGQVGVTAGGPPFGVRQGVWLDEGADVRGELGVLDLAGRLAAGGEVLGAAEPGAGLVLAAGDGLSAPAEAALGGAGAAATQRVGDLGLEEAALVTLEAARRRADQLLGQLRRGIHRGTLREVGGYLRTA